MILIGRDEVRQAYLSLSHSNTIYSVECLYLSAQEEEVEEDDAEGGYMNYSYRWMAADAVYYLVVPLSVDAEAVEEVGSTASPRR
jgi:hypothetical protein